MITIDSDPKLNPIYIGAEILIEMSLSELTQLEVDYLYQSIKSKLGTSYEVFAYALDWLYIIGAINLNENGLLEYATA